MLSDQQVRDLYASKTSRPKQRKVLGNVLTSEGWKPITKMGDWELGRFEGRAGSIRRSRKGASRRLPNGRRFYLNTTNEVLAYKLSR